MLSLFAASALTGFAPARAWIAGWGAAPDLTFAADFSGDGRADMVAFDPRGNGSLHILPTVDGFKPSDGMQILPEFGKNCQAAAVGILTPGQSPVLVGVFDGQTVRLAKKDGDYPLKVQATWAKLPHKVGNPAMAVIEGHVLVFSTRDGGGYMVDPANPASPTAVSVPRGTVWVGDAGADLVGKDTKGELFWLDRANMRRKGTLGHESPGSQPAAMPGLVVFGDKAWTPKGLFDLAPDGLPAADVQRAVGTSGKFDRPIIYEWRRGKELGTGTLVELRRGIIEQDKSLPDSDPESDAYNRCSGNDGLLDGWKLYGYRGLDLKAMGCKPGEADVVCLISRFDGVKPETLDAGIKRIESFYTGLPCKNADGTTGIHFHPLLIDPIKGDDERHAWQSNRAKYLPEKWRGIVHWMQVTPGGGGQSNELSDGGTCGQNALWAVFVHEFGHQLGLNHEGFSPGYASPIYTSLMNYTYSYRFNDSLENVHYSDGSFSSLKLREDDLDETLPFPMEKVSFLGKGPYHFPLKDDGDKTLVDWNRNGIFGEKHVKASITYAYSISGGTRDDLGRSRLKTAPWLLEHRGDAYLLYGMNDLHPDKAVDPTISPDRPGRLVIRRLLSSRTDRRKKWEPETVIESGGLAGDPVATSYDGKILVAYPTQDGVVSRWVWETRDGYQMSSPTVLDGDPSLTPTIGVYQSRAYVFLTNPVDGKVSYRIFERGTLLPEAKTLEFPSTNPVGLCTDTKTGEAIMALAQDQPEGRTHRWQYRRLTARTDGTLVQASGPFWVEGEKGGSRGTGRMIVLFDASKDAGPKGRVTIIAKGLTDEKTPWSCCYMAHEIADPNFHGGWLVKRYYDEWTQSRSAPAACWFDGDMLYAYRWVDGGQGEGDNILHVAYRGTGLQRATLTDFDDISYVRGFGLANSIPVLGRE